MLPTDNTDNITLIRDSIQKARRAKQQMTKGIQVMAAGNVSANAIIEFMLNLNDAIRTWGEVAAIPGINVLARDLLRKPGLDFAAELSNLISLSQAAIDWIDANFPKDANGYLLKDKIVANSIEVRTFSPAQTANFRALLQSTLDQIQ